MTIKSDAEFLEYAKSSKPLVVKFFSLWDSSSRGFEELFFSVSEDFSTKAVFMQSNINSNPDLAGSFKVVKVPAVLVFKSGNLIAKFTSFPSKRAFKEELESVLR